MPKRSPSPQVVVIGGANTDFLIRAARLPLPGETVNGEEFDYAEAGGKGANQAVAAARLGAHVTFVGRVGADDRGRALLRRLAAEGIDVRHVVRDARNHTGVAQISVDAHGEKQILVAPGANQRLSATDVRRPAVARAIAKADMLVLQFEVPLVASLAAARLAHRAGVPIILDPAPALGNPEPSMAKQQSALLQMVTVLRANEHETEALTGIPVTNGAAAELAAEHLLSKFGLRGAIIAAGQGNLAVWRESDTRSSSRHFSSVEPLRAANVPRLRVKTVDATGAGDAFAAALAVALAEGQTLSSAAHFANAAAALATTKIGAQPALPKRAAVSAFLRRSRETA